MEVHIGKEIAKRYQDSGLKLSEFAKRINTGPRNVYALFDRKDISTDRLRKISQVLNFNFFQLYEKTLPTQVKEPKVPYMASVIEKKILVLVELDGEPVSLDKTMKKLTAINEAI